MAARQRTHVPAPVYPTPSPSPAQVAVGLARASTDQQEHSVGDQRAEIERWCREHEHQLLEVFEDEGVSGSKLDRPGLVALLEFVERHPQKGTVVIWKRNRLARPDDPRDGLLLERRIERAGWRLQFLQGPQQSGNALVDTLMATIEHHQGGEYLRSLASDVLRGQLRRVLAGTVYFGVAPYGYAREVTWPNGTVQVIPRLAKQRAPEAARVRLVPGDPTEIATVRWIFERYASGEAGTPTIVDELNQKQAPPPRPGGTWEISTIRKILMNPAYAGDLAWNRTTSGKFMCLLGQRATPRGKDKRKGSTERNPQEEWIRVPGNHEALVPREQWEKANAVLTARGKEMGGARTPLCSYPLRGLVYCGVCGRPMSGCSRGFPDGRRYARYQCSTYTRFRQCRQYAVSSPALEEAVLRKLQEVYVPLVACPDFRERVVALLKERRGTIVPAKEAERLRKEQGQLEVKVAQAIENMGEVPPAVALQVGVKVEAWSTRLKAIEAELASLEKRRVVEGDLERDADGILALIEELGQANTDTPAPQLHDLLSRLVERVELRFEPGKVPHGRTRTRSHTFLGGEILVVEELSDVGGFRTAGTSNPRGHRRSTPRRPA